VTSAEKFSANGHWYRTGDTGSVDEKGFFSFSARDDDALEHGRDGSG
jgi:acetyl-CoA synthetase